jgi:ActR/RegA family two-component response regulator/tetratricopeptide (TPR) repeat protein
VQEKKVLILEDDATLGAGLVRGLAAKGYEAVLCNKADLAYQKLKLESYSALIVDCFLPGEKGVDFASKVKEQHLSDAPLFLISGVFKDKVFIREAMARTGAAEFFVKPFMVDEAIYIIESQNHDRSNLSRPPLFRIFWTPEAETGDILKAVDLTSSCHGYDLAIILGFVLQGGLPGKLTVTSPEKQIINVCFNNDQIVGVEDGSDSEKLFVTLAQEYGYLNADHPPLNLNPGERVDQYLIRENLISPHAGKELQMGVLKSQLAHILRDTTYTINFDITPDLPSDKGLNMGEFRELLLSWVWSHIPYPWLKAFYVRWMDQSVIKGPMNDLILKFKEQPLFKRLTNIDKLLTSGKSLDWILTDGNYNEHDFLAAMHFLAINRAICFGERGTNFGILGARLKKTMAEIEGKNYFEILNISKNAPETEIKKSYHELANVFHPDKQPADLPKELADYNKQIFDKIQKAYNALSKDSSKKDYLIEMEQGDTAALLEAETVLESALRMVSTNQFQPAVDILDRVRNLDAQMPKLLLVRMWATIKMGESKPNVFDAAEFVTKLEEMSNDVRNDPFYLFVKGLLQKHLGNKNNAIAYFEKAVASKADFVAARRELNVLKLEGSNAAGKQGFGLGNVIGNLFKRK